MSANDLPILSRRQMLKRTMGGIGSLALAATLAEQGEAAVSALAPKPAHFAPRAKRMVFLFLNGAPSHVDLFDWKPELAKRHGEPIPFNLPGNDMTFGLENTRLMGPLGKFRPRGESGLMLSDLLPNWAACADDICLLHGVHGDNSAHQPATFQLYSGATMSGRPSLGAWLSYGLGTENQNLPSFVALGSGSTAQTSGFLPAIHQGTQLTPPMGKSSSPPIRYLTDRSMPAADKRQQFDLIQSFNRHGLERSGGDMALEGMIETMELAFRMQTDASALADFNKESAATLAGYGIGAKGTDLVGRQCLLARRCLEAGVRFVSLSLGSWDHHGDIATKLPESCGMVDKPIAGLLTDLKQRGLLDDTLVVCLGEFGRTPYWQDDPRRAGKPGREHNRYGFSAWLAGGGVKGGFSHGETDEFGFQAVAGKVHVHDLHATILHLLGIDHKRLTWRHAGRDYRLTDVFGSVVSEIIA